MVGGADADRFIHNYRGFILVGVGGAVYRPILWDTIIMRKQMYCICKQDGLF